MPNHRKLAAILFADIVGFSRLTGADENLQPPEIEVRFAPEIRHFRGLG